MIALYSTCNECGKWSWRYICADALCVGVCVCVTAMHCQHNELFRPTEMSYLLRGEALLHHPYGYAKCMYYICQ